MLMMNLLRRFTSPSPSGKNVLPALQVQVLKRTDSSGSNSERASLRYIPLTVNDLTS